VPIDSIYVPPPAAGRVMDVRQFGAKGDGVADDTLAIQAAIDAAAGTVGLQVGGRVAIPQGTYAVTRLQARSNVVVECDGTILHTGALASQNWLLKIDVDGLTNPLQWFRWRGGRLVAKQSATNPTSALVFLGTAQHCTVEECDLQGGDRDYTNINLSTVRYAQFGIRLYGRQNQACYYNSFLRNRIRGCDVGIVVDGWDTAYTPSATNVANQNTWLQNRVFDCRIGRYDQSGGGNMACQDDYESNTERGIVLGEKAVATWYVECRAEENTATHNLDEQIAVETSSTLPANTGYRTARFLGVCGKSPQESVLDYFARFESGNGIWASATDERRGVVRLRVSAVGQSVLESVPTGFATSHRTWYVRGDGRFVYGPGDDVTDATEVGFQRYQANMFGPGATAMLRADGGIITKVKTGGSAPVDADFPVTPRSGTLALDETNSKLYMRVGSAWKSVTLT
jgi:hypothetical protein